MVEQLTQHDPRRIGPFEVLGRLGAGGMGLVYLARSASGRRVAIKTVRTELAEDQLFRVRFTREVEAARAVSGFYTAAVVDADPRAAVPWLATAYVPAPSLEEIVNECGPLPAQAVRWLAAGIAEALQSIHGAGLVHRDLKPSNVLVVEDGPRVIDFGIASGVSNTRLTMTNVAVGTPAYMSPEQARDSRSVTGASDVFSLGSTLVFAATGHAPFHGANPVETVFMLLREGPDLEGLPDELRPLIESCMQMEADQRPSPADLQSQLAPHLFGSGSDDSGTASAWLPAGAVALIERRRGGRATVAANGQRAGSGRGAGRAAPAAPPSPPASPPMPAPQPVPAPPRPGRTGRRGVRLARPAARAPARTAAAIRAAAPARCRSPRRSARRLDGPGDPGSAAPPAAALSAAPPAVPRTAPRARTAARLARPIGPGPRAAAGASRAAGRCRHELGAAARSGPATGVPPQGPANGAVPRARPAARPRRPRRPRRRAEPGRWRPWRFRMSNDVWGTPAVAGDLLYVTSFEVHALDVATGRRQFKTRDVAWAMAVADGRIHASDGPSLYALDADDGTERWRLHTDGWVYSLKVDRGTVVTGTRGGGVQAWEAANGEKLWEIGGAQTDFETPEAGPVVHDGTVYVWAGRPAARAGGAHRRRALVVPGRRRRVLRRGAGAAAARAGRRRVRRAPAPGCSPSTSRAATCAGTSRRPRSSSARPPSRRARPSPAAGSTSPTTSARSTRSTPRTAATAGASPPRPGSPPNRSLVADGLVHLGSGSALYTLDAVTGTPQVAVRRRAARSSAHRSSRTAGCTSARPTTASTRSTRWAASCAGSWPPAARSPARRWRVGGVVYACSKDRCVYALDAAKGTGLARRS